MSFNWDALLLGAASFLIIGLFHPDRKSVV